MIARKILLTHMSDTEEHKIDEIIETLASKLYFHGHPINRKEAKAELGLKVSDNPSPELETAMWKLYLDFETELENGKPFDPMADIFAAAGPIQQPQPGQVCVVPFGTNVELEDIFAVIESDRLSSMFKSKRRGNQHEPLVRAETRPQRVLYRLKARQ